MAMTVAHFQTIMVDVYRREMVMANGQRSSTLRSAKWGVRGDGRRALRTPPPGSLSVGGRIGNGRLEVDCSFSHRNDLRGLLREARGPHRGGTSATMLGTTRTMLGTTRTMLGTTRTMLDTTRTMLGTNHTMLGTTRTILGDLLVLPRLVRRRAREVVRPPPRHQQPGPKPGPRGVCSDPSVG